MNAAGLLFCDHGTRIREQAKNENRISQQFAASENEKLNFMTTMNFVCAQCNRFFYCCRSLG